MSRIRATRRRKPTADALRDRAGHLSRTYGLSLDGFAEIVAAQSGTCAICELAPAHGPLHCDHDRLAPGDVVLVRGALDFRCNVGLSHFRDTPVFLLRAALYLIRALTQYAEGAADPMMHPRMPDASSYAAAEKLLTEIASALAKLEQLTRGVAA